MVIAKYISLILYVLIICGILYVGSNFFSLLNHHNVSRGIRIRDLLLVLSYLMLILSAYLPLGYEHIEIKFMLFDVMVFINTWLLQGVLIGYGSNILNSLSKLFFNLNYIGVAVVLFLIGAVIYIISLNTSIKILERKDF